MKGLIFGLLLGCAIGYQWGWKEGFAGKEHVATRVLNSFGADRIKQDNAARDSAVEAAGDDTTRR
jgi:hypothetical protein